MKIVINKKEETGLFLDFDNFQPGDCVKCVNDDDGIFYGKYFLVIGYPCYLGLASFNGSIYNKVHESACTFVKVEADLHVKD